MALFPWTRYPYSNFQELNLDWILETVKGLKIETDNIEQNIVTEVNRKLEEMNDNGELTVTAEDNVARADIATISAAFNGSNMRGSKILVYGDSIAFGQIDALGTQANKPWPEKMGELIGATVNNQSLPGRSMTTYNADSLSTLVDNLTAADLADYDYIIIALGNNDVGHGVSLKGSDRTAFEYAYKYTLDKLYLLKPNIQIILCTNTANSNPYGLYTPGNICSASCNDAIRRIAQEYHLSVIDFAFHSGINTDNVTFFTWDGVHYTTFGYEFLGVFAARAIYGGNPGQNEMQILQKNIDLTQLTSGDEVSITGLYAVAWKMCFAFAYHDGALSVAVYDRQQNTQMCLSTNDGTFTGTMSYLVTNGGGTFESLTMTLANNNQIKLKTAFFGSVGTVKLLMAFV